MGSAKQCSFATAIMLIMLTSLSICESTLSSSSSSSSASVFDILPKFGLPSGLLPDCVKKYSLSADTGDFVVDLDHTCYIQFDYLVYYDKRITGTLKIGSISNLKGIQVKRLFLWFDVDEIKVDLPPSDSIYFQVGLINKKLSVHQFETVHSCRPSTSAHLPSSWTPLFQLPTPVDQEVPMLLTE